MAEKSPDLVIDLEKPDEQLIEDIVALLSTRQDKLEKEGQLALNFMIKKKVKSLNLLCII